MGGPPPICGPIVLQIDVRSTAYSASGAFVGRHIENRFPRWSGAPNHAASAGRKAIPQYFSCSHIKPDPFRRQGSQGADVVWSSHPSALRRIPGRWHRERWKSACPAARRATPARARMAPATPRPRAARLGLCLWRSTRPRARHDRRGVDASARATVLTGRLRACASAHAPTPLRVRSLPPAFPTRPSGGPVHCISRALVSRRAAALSRDLLPDPPRPGASRAPACRHPPRPPPRTPRLRNQARRGGGSRKRTGREAARRRQAVGGHGISLGKKRAGPVSRSRFVNALANAGEPESFAFSARVGLLAALAIQMNRQGLGTRAWADNPFGYRMHRAHPEHNLTTTPTTARRHDGPFYGMIFIDDEGALCEASHCIVGG